MKKPHLQSKAGSSIPRSNHMFSSHSSRRKFRRARRRGAWVTDTILSARVIAAAGSTSFGHPTHQRQDEEKVPFPPYLFREAEEKEMESGDIFASKQQEQDLGRKQSQPRRPSRQLQGSVKRQCSFSSIMISGQLLQAMTIIDDGKEQIGDVTISIGDANNRQEG